MFVHIEAAIEVTVDWISYTASASSQLDFHSLKVFKTTDYFNHLNIFCTLVINIIYYLP